MESFLVCLAVAFGAPPADDAQRWACVLGQVDARRATAYRAASADAVTSVYVRGSPLARADREVLRGYTSRGLRITDLAMDVSEVTVVAARDDGAELRVVDRVARLTVRDAQGDVVRVPRDEPTARTISLRREDGQWRIAAVSDEVRPR